MQPSTSLPELSAGTLIGDRYTVLRCVGTGSVGTVYQVENHDQSLTFALKVLFPAITAVRPPLNRFLDRVERLIQSPHPGIAQLVATPILGNETLGVLTEFVTGETLEQRIQRAAPLHFDEVLYYLWALTGILEHAHRYSVPHGYLKPGNIFITEDGRMKVTDFGVAELLIPTEEKTELQEFRGDAFYLAPEQLTRRESSVRADVFAVGAIAYELLTGQPPFQGRTFDQIKTRILRSSASSLTNNLGPDIPIHIVRIVAKALTRDPMGRYGTMEEVRARLAAHVDENEVSARATYVVRRNERTGKPRRAVRQNRGSILPSFNPQKAVKLAIGIVGLVMLFLLLYHLGSGNRAAFEQKAKQNAEREVAGARRFGEALGSH